MAGLFFCLASAEGAGLLFCPTTSRIQAFTACFVLSMQLYHPRHKTAHTALQAFPLRFDLFRRPRYQTDTSGYNAVCTTLERITAPGRLAPIPDTTTTPGRCTAQRSRPIIIRYIYSSSAPPLWAHARQCSRSQTMPARRGLDTSHAQRLEVWHRVSGQGAPAGIFHPAGQSSSRDAAGGAEPLAAAAVSLFGLSPDS